MSDDEKSDEGPPAQGWMSYFTPVLGEPYVDSSKTKIRRGSKRKDVDGNAGFFGGLFGGTAGTSNSAADESSDDDVAPKLSSREGTDVQDTKSVTGTPRDPSHAGSDVGTENDGENVSEANSSVSLSDSFIAKNLNESTVSDTEKGESSEQASPRNRRRKLQQFSIEAPAADLAEPEPEEVKVPEEAKAPVKQDEPKTELGDSGTSGGSIQPAAAAPTDLWSTVGSWFGIGGASAVKSEVPTADVVSKTASVPEQQVEPSSLSPTEQARTMLPSIPDPPRISWEAQPPEVNSFIDVDRMNLNLLRPREFSHFQGRLKGWPRAVAPRWSSDGKNLNVNHQRVNAETAVHLFRVS